MYGTRFQIALAFYCLLGVGGVALAETGSSFFPSVVGGPKPVFNPPYGHMGTDLSTRFQALMTQPPQAEVSPSSAVATLSPELLAELRRYKIIIVPGFKNEAMGRSSGDFVDQIAVLKEASLTEGTDFLMLKSAQSFSGLAPAADNAAAIVSAIQSSTRPVLLITQSKGSVDALMALVNSPQTASHVRAWFSIQGALWGTAIADTIETSWQDRTIFNQVMRLLGGEPQTIVELGRSYRYGYMAANEIRISEIAQETKVISFASWKENSAMWWPLRKLDASFFPGYQKVQSDGVMLIGDALLPNSDFIVAPGIDHGDSTLQTQPSNRATSAALLVPEFDRKVFMRAILTLMLQ